MNLRLTSCLLIVAVGICLIVIGATSLHEVLPPKDFWGKVNDFFTNNPMWNPLIEFFGGTPIKEPAIYSKPAIVKIVIGGILVVGAAGILVIWKKR